MTNTRQRLRQVSVRTLLIMTLLAGIFAAGFRKGYSEVDPFEKLIYVIETTVVPDIWEQLGGPASVKPYPETVSYIQIVDPSDGREDDVTNADRLVGGGVIAEGNSK